MAIADLDQKLTHKCSNFIDLTSRVSLVALSAIKCFLCGDQVTSEACAEQVRRLEEDGDVMRRDTEAHLYSEALIPESRGDLLGLIESTDDIIDQIKKVVLLFSVETPMIPSDFQEDFYQLTNICMAAVDEVLLALRLYLYEPRRVSAQLPRVYEKEKAADKQAALIKHRAFRQNNLSLSQQMHLRYFAHNIDQIADRAENLADRLSIAAIKQTQ